MNPTSVFARLYKTKPACSASGTKSPRSESPVPTYINYIILNIIGEILSNRQKVRFYRISIHFSQIKKDVLI